MTEKEVTQVLDSACVECGAALAQPATGRPRRFCSAACRRLREVRRRRIERELQRLEELRSECALRPVAGDDLYLARLAARERELEAALRSLFE